jgi:N-acetyl-beta-hexosaminidase
MADRDHVVAKASRNWGADCSGGGAGGFYTQQEYIEIDEYAKAKFYYYHS